jgi:hypothetical protein
VSRTSLGQRARGGLLGWGLTKPVSAFALSCY